MNEINKLISEAKADPALLAGARIGTSYYQVKIDARGHIRITRDGDRISLADAVAFVVA